MLSLSIQSHKVRALFRRHADLLVILLPFTAIYIGLAWIVNGGDKWWIIDFVSGKNIFYGDDAYRFFLARSAWLDPSLYAYNFALPVNLVLENAVVTLTGADLLKARCLHALIAAASLCLVWRSGLMLGINRVVMAGAVLVMGLMPLYALVSISFYGEAWLGFGLSLVIWLFLRKEMMAASVVAGLLPLIRPEGIFFLAPFWLYMVKEKYWRESVLMIMPGFLYFLFLLAWLPDIRDFMNWRIEIRRILSKFLYENDPWLLLSTYSPLFTIPAVLGFLYPSARRLWPFMLGSGIWVLFLQGGISTRQSSYEPRYIYSLIPVFTLMWASFFAWLWQGMTRHDWLIHRKILAIVLASFFLVSLHMGEVNALNLVVREKGWSWTIQRVLRGEWEDIFPAYLPGYVDSYKSMSKKIHELADNDKSIDRIVMFDYLLYYFVDPGRLRAEIRVDYPAVPYLVSHFSLNGQVFTQHPRGDMYSYLRFSKPEFEAGERRALYADLMPMPRYPHRWEKDQVELYLFSYKESDAPDVDLDKAPPIDPEAVLQLYKRVFSW